MRGRLDLPRPLDGSGGPPAWSFHPRKILTTGEGGMLTTMSRADWAARIRRLREHGMSVSAADRHASILSPPEEYLEVGFNFRMTDLQASIGLVQLGRLGRAIAERRELAAVYQERLSVRPDLRTVVDPAFGATNFQSFWIELLEDYPLTREQLLGHLASRGISARRGIMAAHRQIAYAGYGQVHLPVSDRLTDNTLILPLFHGLTEAQQCRVIDAIVDVTASVR